jgi:hypothetical protein
LERVEIFDVDAAAFAEQHHQDRKSYRRLGRGNGQNEEDEYLAADVAALTGKCHEIKIHREQHELNAHQQHDDILAIQEYPRHRDGEQYP